jgi:hypothetical protein
MTMDFSASAMRVYWKAVIIFSGTVISVGNAGAPSTSLLRTILNFHK